MSEKSKNQKKAVVSPYFIDSCNNFPVLGRVELLKKTIDGKE